MIRLGCWVCLVGTSLLPLGCGHGDSGAAGAGGLAGRGSAPG
jgi:hypothetical protein